VTEGASIKELLARLLGPTRDSNQREYVLCSAGELWRCRKFLRQFAREMIESRSP